MHVEVFVMLKTYALHMKYVQTLALLFALLVGACGGSSEPSPSTEVSDYRAELGGVFNVLMTADIADSPEEEKEALMHQQV